MQTGHCLCGAISYRLDRPAKSVSVCHCAMCRRQTGGPLMAVHETGEVAFNDPDTLLTWFDSSDWGQRGFCGRCGTNLAWRLRETGETLVAAGTLDGWDGLKIESHIFHDEKPAFYDFADDTPRLSAAETIAYFEAQGDVSAPKA